MSAFLAVLFIAALAEGLTEYLARPIVEGVTAPDAEGGTGSPRPYVKPLWLRYAAALVGIGLAIALKADLFAAAGLETASPWVAYVLTGILAGRGSNYMHDLVDTWRTAQP